MSYAVYRFRNPGERGLDFAVLVYVGAGGDPLARFCDALEKAGSRFIVQKS
jgi:hypothetical protein